MDSSHPANLLLRGVIFDWYDGPVSGIARAAPDGPPYAFQMVAWVPGGDTRVYVLRPVGQNVFERAQRLNREVPPAAREAERERAWAMMEEMLRQAGEITHVVVSDRLLEGEVCGRAVPPGELRERLAAMVRREPSQETDGFCFSNHPLEEWLAALDPVRPYARGDLD